MNFETIIHTIVYFIFGVYIVRATVWKRRYKVADAQRDKLVQHLNKTWAEFMKVCELHYGKNPANRPLLNEMKRITHDLILDNEIIETK